MPPGRVVGPQGPLLPPGRGAASLVMEIAVTTCLARAGTSGLLEGFLCWDKLGHTRSLKRHPCLHDMCDNMVPLVLANGVICPPLLLTPYQRETGKVVAFLFIFAPPPEHLTP